MSLLNALLPRTRNLAHTADHSGLAHSVKPVFSIKESTDAFAVTVHLPGVTKDGLEITAEDGEVRIIGRRAWQQPSEWTSLYRESSTAPFALVLTHDNTVDTDKVAAELVDGVLRLSLPKPEAVKPRKIAVS